MDKETPKHFIHHVKCIDCNKVLRMSSESKLNEKNLKELTKTARCGKCLQSKIDGK